MILSGCQFNDSADQNPASLKGDEVSISQNNHQDLLVSLNDIIRNDDADYSIYVNYFEGGEPLEINNQQIRSASMIKVFIMADIYEKIKSKDIKENQELLLTDKDKVGGAGSLSGWPSGSHITVNQLLKLMITESDNTATNMLIDLLGMDDINQYIRNHGYSQTILQRKMMDNQAVKIGHDNFTSSHDLGTFFSRLYQHQIISPEYDEKMIDLLKGQTDTECFPAVLPDYPIAHKTGELERLYHDGGIIYAPAGAYVLVVLTENQKNPRMTLETMREITQIVNDYRKSLSVKY